MVPVDNVGLPGRSVDVLKVLDKVRRPADVVAGSGRSEALLKVDEVCRILVVVNNELRRVLWCLGNLGRS